MKELGFIQQKVVVCKGISVPVALGIGEPAVDFYPNRLNVLVDWIGKPTEGTISHRQETDEYLFLFAPRCWKPGSI